MSYFCVKCSSKDAEMEILTKRHYEEMQCMKAKLEKLRTENEALILDVAFYGGGLTNLSCNNK
jgi:C-terminal processing protease CtpA/Prc